MKKKIVSLITLFFVSVSFLFPAYSFGMAPKPLGHNFILFGLVKCKKNGVLKPVPGVKVNITEIYGAKETYELPSPESTTTDANGLWVLTFSTPFGVAIPETFSGELFPACPEGRIAISERLGEGLGYNGIYDFATGQVGSLADYVREVVSKTFKLPWLKLPFIETEFIAYTAYVYTEIDCCDGKPVVKKTDEPVDVSEGAGQPVDTPSQAPATPEQPPATDSSIPPIPPGVPDISRSPDAQPGDYGKCAKKCKPIIDKLESLRKQLSDLENSESDEVKNIKKELSRLKVRYEQIIKANTLQKYAAPDGSERIGRADQEESYGKHEYRPVPGTKQVQLDSDQQKWLDYTQQEIAKAEGKLNQALSADDKRKQPERERIRRQMDKIKLEYDNCIKGCDKLKTGAEGFRMDRTTIDFLSHPGLTTDTSQGPQETPQQQDNSSGGQTAPVPQKDAATGERPMPLEQPRGLEDTSGFDKEPPVNTKNYETTYQAPGSEGIQYKNLDLGQVAVDAGIHYKNTRDGGMNIDTTALATGGKGHLREWEVTDTVLEVNGAKLRPYKKDKFYVARESAFRKTATAVFAWLGSQYKDRASEAQSGEVCPVTGQPKAGTDKKGSTAEAIDKAGMAAGLGLLVSQAKGEITGQKCSFNLNKEQAQEIKEGKGALKIGMENRETSRKEKAEIPLGKVSY
ncbi:MAG: hypothetical protein Q7K98_03385 [Candidatus Omnitrophota bacterium]|nr:hypothetical protein [Candidatus Omnitrophota bacterium]